jgi:hypothetical protein
LQQLATPALLMMLGKGENLLELRKHAILVVKERQNVMKDDQNVNTVKNMG